MKLKFDISHKDFLIVQAILEKNLPNNCQVWVFGSRAKNKAFDYSDLDLALECENKVTLNTLNQLKTDFEKSKLPYRVDVLDLNAVEPYFQDIINKKKILFSFKAEGKVPQLRFSEFSDKWEENKLGDIGKISMCKRIMKHETSTSGKIPFYKIGTFGKKADAFIDNKLYKYYKEKYSFPNKGDILISASGTIGRTVIYDGLPAYFQDSNIVWIANNEATITNSFLSFCYENVKWNTENTTIARLYNNNLKNIKLSIPTKPEQQKIANFLTTVDNKIEQLSKKQALLGLWKKGLMQKIFSQAIRFKADYGRDFPDWEEKRVTDIAKTSIGLVTSMTPYYVDKGIPLIRNNNIFPNKIRKDKLIQLNYAFDELNKNRRLATNDIVTVHTGDIGISAVIDEELNGCQGFATLNTRILDNKKISSLYLCWYYNSTRNIRYALSMATGDGRSNYNLKDFNKAIISLPCFEEQTNIANFLSSIDTKIEQVGRQLDESKQFKKALLQQMFV